WPGRADQTGDTGGCRANPGTRSTDRFARQLEAASAESQVRPGPRTPTLRPRRLCGRDGSEALPTFSLSNRTDLSAHAWKPCSGTRGRRVVGPLFRGCLDASPCGTCALPAAKPARTDTGRDKTDDEGGDRVKVRLGID